MPRQATDWRIWMLGVLVPINMAMAGFLAKILWNDLSHLGAKVDLVAEIMMDKENQRSIDRINNWAAWDYQINVNKLLFAQLDIPRHLWPAPPYWLNAVGPADSTHWR